MSHRASNQKAITMGVSGMLLFLLAFLKLVGKIDWSWWVVLLPSYWWIVFIFLYAFYRFIAIKFFEDKKSSGIWVEFNRLDTKTHPQKNGKYLVTIGHGVPKTDDWVDLFWVNSKGVTHWFKLN